MANIKFSDFAARTTSATVDYIVGYQGADNIQISPTDFLATITAAYLPLTGGTMTGDIDFNDNVKANFGTTGDLEIYHDGSNSFIRETGTGNFYLRASDSLYVQRTSDGLEMAQFTGGGGSFLYFNGNLK